MEKKITRRNFLKMSALAAGALALPGCAGSLVASSSANNAGSAAEEIKYGMCHGNCIGGCRFKQTLRDGIIVKSEMAPYPDENYNRICSKGLSHAQRTYSPKRIQYPMRRVDGTERGAGQWERISWDEAITEITGKWKSYIDQYGPASIGYSNPHNLTAQMGTYTGTIASLLGFSSFDNQADQAGVWTFIRYMGIMPPLFAGNEAADIANAKNLFIWSSNAAISQLHCSTFIWDMKKKGGKVIGIDPNFTPTVARYADVHIPVRLATDACLFMGMSHIVIEEGLIDQEFLKTKTVAPLLVKKSDGKFLRQEDLNGATIDPKAAPYATVLVAKSDGTAGLASEVTDPLLTGVTEINGIEVTTAYDLFLERLNEYPLAKCAEVCNVDVETIRSLARTYADGPTTTLFQYGSDHYTNGHTGYVALITLAALTGNLAKRGASLTQGGNQAGFGLAGSAEWSAKVKPNQTTSTNVKGEVEGALSITHQKLKEFFDTGMVNGKKIAGEDFTFKSWLIAAANPVAGALNRKVTLEVFNALDLVVVQDIVWTESAKYADIVLPVSYYTEYEDVTNGVAVSIPFVNLQEKCNDPAFESKTDYEIFNLYAKGLGKSQIICPTYDEWLKLSFAESAAAQKQGVTIESLRRDKTARMYAGADGGTYVGPIATPSGRVEFYQEVPVSNHPWPGEYDVDHERMVYWEPPLEAWSYSVAGYEPSELAKKYPLSFHWKRSRFATHTNYSVGNHWLDELDPEPYIRINTEDAAARGIKTGDLVKVFNDRGYCVIKAHCDAGLAPGGIDTPQRYNYYLEGHMADLSHTLSHPFINNSNYNDCQVEVQKA